MKKCCGTNVPHCHCGGDKGHNILPGCPGYGERGSMLDALVVGGDSRIGRALFAHLQAIGLNADFTSRRLDSSGIYLDLFEPTPLPPARVTYLCAAITGFGACEGNTDAWHVNVNGTLKVARDQVAQGGRVVFLSSSAAENHLGKDYGFYKLKAEQELATLADNAAVVRFGPVKSDTRETYPDGYYDPVDMDVLTEVLASYCESFLPGVWPVSNARAAA